MCRQRKWERLVASHSHDFAKETANYRLPLTANMPLGYFLLRFPLYVFLCFVFFVVLQNAEGRREKNLNVMGRKQKPAQTAVGGGRQAPVDMTATEITSRQVHLCSVRTRAPPSPKHAGINNEPCVSCRACLSLTHTHTHTSVAFKIYK